MKDNNQILFREVEDYIEKGKQAYKKHNYEYAIELFNHTLTLKQDLPEARHYLHLSKIENFKENPPSIISKGIYKVKAQAYILNAKKLKSDGKPNESLAEYEKALSIDPLNTGIFIKLAKLLLELDKKEMGINTFKEVITIDSENIEALKQLGKLYQEKGEYEKAKGYFKKVKEISPTDMDAQKGLKDLGALQTMDKSKWEEQETFRTKIKDEDEAKKLEKETKTSKTEKDIDFLIKEDEEELKLKPQDISLLFKIADLYREKKDLAKTQQTYKKILEIQPDNDIAKKNIDDLEIKKIDEEIISLEQKLKDNPHEPNIHKKLDEFREKKQNLDFEEVKKTIEKFPNDSTTRFRYGVLLKQRKKLNEAISQFQESVKSPPQRFNSLNMLGLCFKEKGMFDLAVTQFKKALSQISEVTDKTKEVIYNLGTTYEKMGKIDEAVNEYKKIYEVDISYKDVAEKIEKAY